MRQRGPPDYDDICEDGVGGGVGAMVDGGDVVGGRGAVAAVAQEDIFRKWISE